jgi:hypothetical protein
MYIYRYVLVRHLCGSCELRTRDLDPDPQQKWRLNLARCHETPDARWRPVNFLIDVNGLSPRQ